jgi:hypothetical protein
VSPALIKQAKRQTGIEADTDLIEFALAPVAPRLVSSTPRRCHLKSSSRSERVEKRQRCQSCYNQL